MASVQCLTVKQKRNLCNRCRDYWSVYARFFRKQGSIPQAGSIPGIHLQKYSLLPRLYPVFWPIAHV